MDHNRRIRSIPRSWACAVVSALLVLSTPANTLANAAVSPAVSALNPDGEVVTILYFWRENCRYCALHRPLLDDLAAANPGLEIHDFDVGHDPAGRETLRAVAARVGFEPTGVPVTVLGDRVWIGSTPAMRAEIQEAIDACRKHPCADPRAPGTPQRPTPAQATPDLSLPGIGEIDVQGRSLVVSTAIIAFVDGFNPCSLWVLSMLLALVINVRSRRRIILVGGTFLLVTAVVYGLFIAGIFKILALLQWIEAIRVFIALFALFFAIVNIKDYFWFQEGLSFTISDRHKPTIYRRIRAILASKSSIWATLFATVVMALGVAMVELPCTAGFPVLWSTMVAAQDVSTARFLGLLGLYMVIYLLDELVIFATVVITLRASKMQDKHGRLLKLIGGVVMLAIAGVLLFAPEVMNGIGGSLAVFAGAFAVVGLVVLVHRVILPRFGISFGSEALLATKGKAPKTTQGSEKPGPKEP